MSSSNFASLKDKITFATSLMKKYYLHNGRTKQGAFSFEELKAMKLYSFYHILIEGMEEWIPITEIKSLHDFIITEKPYYVLGENNQQIPFPFEELTKLNLSPSSLIFHEGWTDWKPAGEVEEFKPLFQQQKAPADEANPHSSLGDSSSVKTESQSSSPGSNSKNEKEISTRTWVILAVIGIVWWLFFSPSGNNVLSSYQKCSECEGSGKIECKICKGSGKMECNTCYGSGEKDCGWCFGTGQKSKSGYEWVNVNGTMVWTFVNGYEDCWVCRGTGNEKCNWCYGEGKVKCNNVGCYGSGKIECSYCSGQGKVKK